MKPLPFALELKHRLPEDAWSWLLPALRQDHWIWSALEAAQLGWRALESLPPELAAWSPAALGLLALEDPAQAAELAFDPLAPQSMPLEAGLEARAAQAYQAWLVTGPQPATPGSRPAEPDQALANCALIALALRQHYQEKRAWRGLFSAISLDRLETRTVLACLYGLVDEPDRLLQTLAEHGNGHPRPDLAVHALLCQPFSPDAQGRLFKALLAGLSPARSLDLINHLAAQRPELALGLAEGLLAAGDLAWADEAADNQAVDLSQQFNQLASSVRLADCYQFAGQPDRAVPLLAETLRLARRLRGHLSARLAQVVAVAQGGSDESWRETAQETSLEAWKQAVQLIPEDPRYVAGLAHTLIDAGRLPDAQSYLAGQQNDGDYHPSISLASALLNERLEEGADTRRHALQALRLVESGQALSQREWIELARLLARLGLPAEAARAAQAGLVHYPLQRDLLEVAAQAQLDLGQPEAALASAYAVQTLSTPAGEQPLEALIVEALEQVGAWENALEAHLSRLDRLASPGPQDFHAVMRCAEHAGRNEVLVETSRSALALDPEDVLAHRGLAQAALAAGDYPQAIEHLSLATRLAPEQPALWLSLVQAHRQAGDEVRAVEALRAASQAVPDHADIHAALGEVYRQQGALTQALSCFRSAAELAPTQENTLHLGQTLYQLGHLTEACQVLEKTYQSALAQLPVGAAGQPDPELVHSYARALLALKQIETAIPLMLEVVRLQPDDLEAGLELCRALLQSSDQPANSRRAIPFLQRMLQLNPDGAESGYHGRLDAFPAVRAEARALLAEAYAANGEWELAMQAFRRALDDPLNHAAERQTRLSTGLGMVALRLEQPEMAVAALAEAAQAEPLNTRVQRALSEAYLASGLAPDAYQTASVVRNLMPEDLDTMLWFVEQGGKLITQPGVNAEQIRQEMTQALKASAHLAPQRADLQLRLGRMLVDEGDTAAALSAFQRMADADEAQPAVSVPQLYQAAQTVRQLGDAPLAIQLLERLIVRASPAETEEPAAILADLYAELALAQHQAGNPELALGAVDQALKADENRAALHAHKAELLQQTGKPEEALESLRHAVRLSPRDPELRLRMARLLDQRNDLPGALEQVQKGLAALPKNSAEDENLSLRTSLNRQAASLAWATLRPHQALEFLELAADAADLPEAQAWDVALRAELSLETGDLESASRAARVLDQIAPGHPRTQAIAARLAHRRRDEDERDRRCRGALRSLLQEQMNQEPETPPSRKEDYIASFLSAAQAAMDSRMWDQALSLLDRLIEIIPETPLAYYLRAQVLAARGEAQLLFQDLEVTSRALGAETVSAETGQAFHQHLAEAQRLLATGVDLESTEELQPYEDECRQRLAVCMARGKALFQPNLRTALVLQSLLQAVTPTAAEVAALVMAFRRCGEPGGAVRAAQVGWRPVFEGEDVCAHPLVLSQVALAEADAAQALAEAQSALEFSTKQGEGWPEQPMMQYLLAHTAYRAGAYPLAMQAIQSALAAWPDESRWQELAAQIYLAQDQAAGLPDRARAIQHLDQAVTLEPERIASRLALGQLYLEEGQAAQAIELLEQASQLDASQPKIWMALAQAQFALGELEQAATSAERALEGNPDPAQALLLRGRIALQTSNPRGALSRAQAILRTAPDHAEAIYLLSQALEALNRPAEALVALEKALSLSPNPLAMQIERVQLLRRSKGLEAGVASLQELVAHNPQQPVLMAMLAEWLKEAGRPEAALQAARLALQEEQGELSEEQRAGMHGLIGLRMRSAGQLDQAIYHLGEAVAHAPANLEAYLELGRAYQERREYRQALKVYQRAMTIANGDYRPYYQAGLVLKDNKDYVAAEAMLRRAAQLAPTEVSVHRLLGAVVALNLVHNRRLTPMEH